MTYELRVQDPSSPTTRYLYEEIIEQMLDDRVSAIDGVFAFASTPGVSNITEDPAFIEYISRGTFSLLVGLDAITDMRTLEALQAAEAEHGPAFSAKVLKNDQQGLFHPKMVRATAADGSGCIIIGSGNLTAGGLRRNIEAYSVFRYEGDSAPSQGEWDKFLADHAEQITVIDADALDRADRNGQRAALGRRLARRTSRKKPAPEVQKPQSAEQGIAHADETGAEPVEEAPPPRPDDRMLVAEVPRAGARWHQVHFNKAAVDDYFRARHGTSERVFLLRHEPDGTLADEPPRPVVFAERNVNHKIELGARSGEPYPDDGPPIVVMRELGLRQHIYLMLFPGEPGYSEMASLLAEEPSIGPGVARVIANRTRVLASWSSLPI